MIPSTPYNATAENSDTTGSPYQYNGDRHLADIGQQMRSIDGFPENLSLATWRLMSEDEQKKRLDDKEFARQETLLAQQEIYQFEAQEVPYFQELNKYHQQNMDFVLLSEQWNPGERAEFIAQGLLPYVNNIMRRYALTTLGEKMGQQTEIRARSRDSQHDAFAEAINSMMRYFERRSDWRLEKQYIYRDGMIGSRGIAGVRSDPKDPNGSLLMKRYRPEEFIWHTRTAYTPRLDDCLYFERIYYYPRAELMRERPEWAAEIREFHPGMWGHLAAHAQLLDVLIKPKIQPTLGSFSAPYTHNPSQYLYWKETVLCRDFYRRHPVTRYMVTDPYKKHNVVFTNYDQAFQWGKATYGYYSNLFLANHIDAQPKISDVQIVRPNIVEKLTWAGTLLLNVEEVGEDFPYKVFAPEFVDGQMTSYFGHGKDSQRMANRMFTRLDMIAGAVKPKQIVNRWGMPPEFTNEDIYDNLLSDTKPLIVSVPHGVSLDNVMMTTTSPQFGSVPETLYKLAADSEQALMGGANFIGMAESAQESGRAVTARQSAANVTLIPYEQEFWKFEEQIGKHAIQLIQRMDPIAIQSIVSDAQPGQPDQITEAILSLGTQSLAEIDMEIEVVETAASPSAKDRIVATAQMVMGQAPDQAKYWTPIILENMDVDKSLRDKVQSQMEQDEQFSRQMQMQMQQHQQQMEKEELDIKYLDRMIKLKQLELEANPPVNRSLVGKVDMTNPAMAASYLTAAQIPADPLQVTRDIAAGTVLRQGALDMQQQHRNAQLLPEEREALRFKAKQPYRNVPKVEDTSARADKAGAK